jgi:hypothetical protein
MNYEELYAELTTVGKTLKDAVSVAQKNQKAAVKNIEIGNLKELDKNLDVLKKAIADQQEALAELITIADGFDRAAYFESGDFAEQMLSCCRKEGVDVHGEYPVYEMFPYKVRIDAENQDVYLDRKKVACMRPSSFVQQVKAGQEKLNREKFNALSFANELSSAYDLAVLKLKKKEDADIYLDSLYKFLVPMGRSRKEYDKQAFAFDVARLYTDELEEIRDGRRFQFGPSRNNAKAIRILDSEGKEQYLATIRFFK